MFWGCQKQLPENMNKTYFIPIESQYLYYLSEDTFNQKEKTLEQYLVEYSITPKAFVTNKSETEITFEIFSTLERLLRNRKFYNNPAKIQDYFELNYRKCFFSGDDCAFRDYRLYEKNGISIIDFEAVILPNLNLQLFKKIKYDDLANKSYFRVVLSWDYFIDINDYTKPNQVYLDDSLIEKYRTLEFSSHSELVCCIMDYLFEYPYYRPDNILNGLYFETPPEKNSIINQYFEYSNFTKSLMPKNRKWDCAEHEEEIKIQAEHLEEIMKYFESHNKRICEIIEKL